jgi:hypothetical protein
MILFIIISHTKNIITEKSVTLKHIKKLIILYQSKLWRNFKVIIKELIYF